MPSQKKTQRARPVAETYEPVDLVDVIEADFSVLAGVPHQEPKHETTQLANELGSLVLGILGGIAAGKALEKLFDR